MVLRNLFLHACTTFLQCHTVPCLKQILYSYIDFNLHYKTDLFFLIQGILLEFEESLVRDLDMEQAFV